MKRCFVALLADASLHGRKVNMYHWASLCLLAIVHYVIVAHQILYAAYKRLLPGFACKVSRGIRPVAPKCIALALNDADLEDADLQRLEAVLEWCATAGMRHAIVFCGQGHITRVSSSLPLVSRVLCKDKVGLQTQADQTEAVQQLDLTVSLLSAEDSLAPLISAATAPGLSLHKSGSLHAAGDQVQTAAWLDKQMQQVHSSKLALTEPDLMLVRLLPARPVLVAGEPRTKNIPICSTEVSALLKHYRVQSVKCLQVFGKAFTLGGYPPWPIRITEMYHMARLRGVSYAQLQTTLQQYCNTVQRFGT